MTSLTLETSYHIFLRKNHRQLCFSFDYPANPLFNNINLFQAVESDCDDPPNICGTTVNKISKLISLYLLLASLTPSTFALPLEDTTTIQALDDGQESNEGENINC